MRPALSPAKQASRTRFTLTRRTESWVDLGWPSYIPRWFTCPKTVRLSS